MHMLNISDIIFENFWLFSTRNEVMNYKPFEWGGDNVHMPVVDIHEDLVKIHILDNVIARF